MLRFKYRAPLAQLDRVRLRRKPEGRELRVVAGVRAHSSMYFIYVLRNLSSGRHYTGHIVDLAQRVGQHNHGVTKSTKNRGCWELIYKEEFATRAEAMRREKYLKSGKGRGELRARLARPS